MIKNVSQVAGCAGCPMACLFPKNFFVAPRIVEGGTRLQVGEAPGEEESIKGEPFVGGSGRLLDAICRKAGLRPDSLSRANVIQCRPPENVFPTDPQAKYISRKDAQDAIQQCYTSHVLPILRDREWKRIDLLGTQALHYVGKRSEGIFKLRGTPLSVEAATPTGQKLVPAVPTLHPAYVMRDQVMFPVVASDLAKSAKPDPEYYQLKPSLREFVAWREGTKTFAFDIETLPWQGNKITIVAFSKERCRAIVVPFVEPYIGVIKGLFGSAEEIIGHNCLQFDLPILDRECVTPHKNTMVWDTMLMHHLIFPDFSGSTEENVAFGASKKGKITAAGHTLGFLGSQFCCKPAWKEEKDNLELYAARDVDVTFRSWLQLKALLLIQFKLENVYHNVSVPLAKICHTMHETGISISGSRIKEVRAKLVTEIANLEKLLPGCLQTTTAIVKHREKAPEGTLSAKTGKPIKFISVESTEEISPWRSNDTLKKYLYDDLGLPPQLHVKSQKITVDKTALYKLYRRLLSGTIVAAKEPHIIEIVQTILKLRKAATLQSSFIKEELLKTEKVHAHFNVHGTNSGRLSSSDPNLQNQPEAAKFLYVPSAPNLKFLEVDFSSIENRLTAWFAHDIDRLARMADPNFNEHKWFASEIFKIPYDKVEKTNDPASFYNKAKRIGHGSNYGLGARKMSNMFDLDYAEVVELVAMWRKVFHVTYEWQLATAARAKRDGFLVNPFQRKRWFWSSNWYTESLSFLPQSTAADIILRCMIVLNHEKISWPLEKVAQVAGVIEPLPEFCKMLVQVHDSLLFEFPPEKEAALLKCLQVVMCQPWAELGGFSVPIAVKIGDPGVSWGELKEINL